LANTTPQKASPLVWLNSTISEAGLSSQLNKWYSNSGTLPGQGGQDGRKAMEGDGGMA
jgi:hypothetical protein